MGADGGIIISKISEIKTGWPKIKEEIIEILQREVNKSCMWNKDDYLEKIHEVSKLTDDISGYSNDEVCDFLRTFMQQCDTPFVLGDHIIFSYGDNVDGPNGYMVCCFIGKYVETWT